MENELTREQIEEMVAMCNRGEYPPIAWSRFVALAYLDAKADAGGLLESSDLIQMVEVDGIQYTTQQEVAWEIERLREYARQGLAGAQRQAVEAVGASAKAAIDQAMREGKGGGDE